MTYQLHVQVIYILVVLHFDYCHYLRQFVTCLYAEEKVICVGCILSSWIRVLYYSTVWIRYTCCTLAETIQCTA